jgi:beta-glucosidase
MQLDWQQLSLSEQIAQMIVVRASGHLFDHQIQYPVWEPAAAKLEHLLKLGVGGVILLGGSAVEVAARTEQLQAWATIPLLIAADIEEGVGQRFAGAVWFPPPMAVAAIAESDLPNALTYAEQMGAATAQEALAIGINWLLAPVVDVNNNPANPVINLRAWGETAETVTQLTQAFLKGTNQHPVLTAAKHFPGHGDTATDSHLELPIMRHDKARLEAVELAPFRAAIAAGVDAVMTAHLKLPVWDAEAPATFSRAIVTDLLRQQMGFDGLIVTDALVMGAITQQYGANEAAVLAVEAGADVLMMPSDPEGAILALAAAVESGRIPQAQIQASLARIWRAKQKVLTALPNVMQLAQPQTLRLVNQILQASLTLHQPVPLAAPDQPRNLILTDDALNCAFLNRQAPAIALPQAAGYSLQVVDSYSPPLDWQANWQTASPPTLLQLFIRGNPFRNSAELVRLAEHWLKHLLDAHQLLALAVYGSPYVMKQFQRLLPADLPYVFSYGQLPTAQAVALKALLSDPAPTIQTREFTD